MQRPLASFGRRFSASSASYNHGKDITIAIPGLNLSGISHGNEQSTLKMLALHGWMDNANTHTFMAPVWADLGFHVVALDLPGHGKSSKRTFADTYDAGGYARAAMEAATALGWDSFALCSHSMGAGISSMVAGAWADRVTALVTLEGIGMNTKDEQVAPSALAAAVFGRAKLHSKLLSGTAVGKIYGTPHDAAMARVATTLRYPGHQSISFHAAQALIERGVERLNDRPGQPEACRFTHDPRLMEPSCTYLSERQMTAYLQAVRCPALCVTGTSGWPWAGGLMVNRICSVSDMEHHHLQGGHHIHLDEATAPTVASVLESFVRRRLPDITAKVEDTLSRKHRTNSARTTGARTSVKLTANKAADGVDQDAVKGAASIASTGVAAFGTSVSAPVPRLSTSQRGEGALSAWTSSHVHVCITESYEEWERSHPECAADVSRVHVQPQALRLLRAHPGFVPLFPVKEAPLTASAATYVWHPMSDSTSGFDKRLLKHRSGNQTDFGCWTPKIVLESMPTLEGVTAGRAVASSSDAISDARAALESRGNSY
jgi:pimeloyl-ACP methyl ester carboxylesterase